MSISKFSSAAGLLGYLNVPCAGGFCRRRWDGFQPLPPIGDSRKNNSTRKRKLLLLRWGLRFGSPMAMGRRAAAARTAEQPEQLPPLPSASPSPVRFPVPRPLPRPPSASPSPVRFPVPRPLPSEAVNHNRQLSPGLLPLFFRRRRPPWLPGFRASGLRAARLLLPPRWILPPLQLNACGNGGFCRRGWIFCRRGWIFCRRGWIFCRRGCWSPNSRTPAATVDLPPLLDSSLDC